MRIQNQLRQVATSVLMAAFVFLPLGAQDTQKPTQQGDQSVQDKKDFTVSVKVDRVLVNVVARDKKGNLIKDLKREDFTILEDGKPQKIVSFDLEQVETAGPEVLQASGGTVGTQKIITSKTSEIPNLTNHRLVILFFDFSGAQEEEIDR